MDKKLNYGFISELDIRQRDEPVDGKWFKLIKPLDYKAKNGVNFRVPAGLNTDFASIPRSLRWLIPRVGRHGKAAVLHDWLCEFRFTSREQADELFLEAMVSLGVNKLRRRAMYFGVAAYTKLIWKKE